MYYHIKLHYSICNKCLGHVGTTLRNTSIQGNLNLQVSGNSDPPDPSTGSCGHQIINQYHFIFLHDCTLPTSAEAGAGADGKFHGRETPFIEGGVRKCSRRGIMSNPSNGRHIFQLLSNLIASAKSCQPFAHKFHPLPHTPVKSQEEKSKMRSMRYIRISFHPMGFALF